MNIQGKSLELFFIDGRPDGMLTAEVFNWTGHVLRVPRTQLKEGIARTEASYTGVYVLLGEKDGDPCAYVGEAEDMRERLRSHAAQKDWWDSVVLITASSNNLHKAHVKYLESRLVEIARDVNAAPLENGNTPPKPSLTESAIANMESFLETLMMVLPAIRVDNFLSKKRETKLEEIAQQKVSPVFELRVPKHNVHATASLNGGEVIVHKGSTTPGEWVGNPIHAVSSQRLYRELFASGVIEVVDGLGVFTKDYAFSSPSSAAQIVSGRSANGRTSWLMKSDGRTTYADWEDAQLAELAE